MARTISQMLLLASEQDRLEGALQKLQKKYKSKFQVMIRAATKPLQATRDSVVKHFMCMLKIPCKAMSFLSSLGLHSSWCLILKRSLSRRKQQICKGSWCSANGYLEPQSVEEHSSVTTFFASCRAPHKDLRDQELITGRQWEICMIRHKVSNLVHIFSFRQHQLRRSDSLASCSLQSFCLLSSESLEKGAGGQPVHSSQWCISVQEIKAILGKKL